MNSTAPRLLTAEALAGVLDLPPASVRRLAREGRLPVYRAGRLLRFDLSEVMAALKAASGTEQEASVDVQA